jgi:pectin methylesterase-like acyl-CoA thioesterase
MAHRKASRIFLLRSAFMLMTPISNAKDIPPMELAIVQQAIAFVATYYGLEQTGITAQVDAMRQEEWQVTVWIGPAMYQHLVVTPQGAVRRRAADGNAREHGL